MAVAEAKDSLHADAVIDVTWTTRNLLLAKAQCEQVPSCKTSPDVDAPLGGDHAVVFAVKGPAVRWVKGN